MPNIPFIIFNGLKTPYYIFSNILKIYLLYPKKIILHFFIEALTPVLNSVAGISFMLEIFGISILDIILLSCLIETWLMIKGAWDGVMLVTISNFSLLLTLHEKQSRHFISTLPANISFRYSELQQLKIFLYLLIDW